MRDTTIINLHHRHYQNHLVQCGLLQEFVGDSFSLNDLETYHPLKFYYLCMILQYHQRLEWQELKLEAELFQDWTQSEWAKDFFDAHQNSNSVLKSSAETLKKLKNHIQSFYQTRFLGRNTKIKGLVEVGEGQKFHSVRETSYFGPSQYVDKILFAIDVLKEKAPESYRLFISQTHTVIALNEPGMVSFSSYDLPGFSSINLKERDSIDLLDDLVHESGHHLLNILIEEKELFIPSPEHDYYSPWRETYRPLRGLFHGFFTFFQGLNLFRELLLSKFFSSQELEKIRMRFCEEYFNLRYSQNDLLDAHERGLISIDGQNLLTPLFQKLDEWEDFFYDTMQALPNFQKTELKVIQTRLFD